MTGVRNILATLAAVLAMLTASGWSSSASACLYEGSMNVVGGGTTATPSSRPAHPHHKASHREAPAPAPAQGPGGPRLDCAACVAVLPAFPAVGSHELMPFMPTEETSEPLLGIAPALDPPPPRAARN